jgi:putative membrane protein
LLHGEPLSATPPVSVVLPLAVAALLYVRGLGRTNAARPRVAVFVAGWAVLGITLATPLHGLGERSLAWHMLQHVLLMAVAAPLLVWSRPSAVLLRGLPRYARAAGVGLMRWTRPAIDAMTGIVIAAVLHGIIIWSWHIPKLYSAGVLNPLVHHTQHLTMFAAALLFWASVLVAASQREWTGPAVLSLFVTTLHMSMLAVLMTFSRAPWYEAYAANPGALEDQQLAGVLMWVPGALPYFFAALGLVYLVLTKVPRTVPADAWHVDCPL